MRKNSWSILAITVSVICTTVSQAQTNSCISPVDGFWQDSNLWSLATAPSITQSGILITNDVAETVTIDSTTANSFASTMTVSNLSINTPSGNADTLYLNNTGLIALHILNNLTIGIITFPATGGGALISTNSTLIVDGSLGGALVDDGTMVIAGSSLITTNCSLQIAPQPNSFSNPTGLLIISNSSVQARDVTLANPAFEGGSGTMQVIGGTMALSSSLTVGASGGSGGSGHLLIADGALLTVNGATGIVHGDMTVTNASFAGGSLFLGSLKSGGELEINDGTVTLNGGLNVAVGDISSGDVTLNGGMLIVTNATINLGGQTGVGHLTVSDGLFLGQTVNLQFGGRLFIQGGTSILSSNLGVGSLATFTVSNGQLIVTNAPVIISAGSQQSFVSGGLLSAGSINLGGKSASGNLLINGGSVTVSAGIRLGNCLSNIIGNLTVNGGQTIVTNAAGTGFVDVQDGQLVLSSGVLQVDRLVMTNTCGSFVHTGGTLIAGSVILDPNAFQVTSVTRTGNDFLVTWLMGPGQTNALQVSNGGSAGSYSTNSFTDIFVVMNNTTAGTLTNYLDIGAATNKPSRFYRARLAP